MAEQVSTVSVYNIFDFRSWILKWKLFLAFLDSHKYNNFYSEHRFKTFKVV